MASVIKLKRSATSGAVPGSLQEGEIAVNLFDRKIYVGNSAGVTAIGGVSGFAADILTELKTVDGASSGLDADLLDGQHGAYYAVAATENSRLANTNSYIATKLDSSSYTTADVRSKAALANTNAYIASVQTDVDNNEATERAALANTNSYIATKLDSSSYTASDVLTKIKTVDGAASGLDADLLDGQQGAYYAVAATEDSRLANTNAYIATKLNSSSYTTADVQSKAALANTNAYIATRASEADSLSRLANTNSYIAGVKTIALNRLGQTATVQISGDVAGTANFSGNSVNVAVTQQNNSVDLGTHTTGNYVATVSGTANEIEVSGSGSETAAVTIGLPDNVTIGNNLTVSGNTHIDGNLTVEGATTYLSTSTVYTDDGMMKLNANNAADTVDSGVYNLYIESATSKYAGYFRDATDGVFKFYDGLQTEPTTTVNTGATGYALAQLDAIIDGGTY